MTDPPGDVWTSSFSYPLHHVNDTLQTGSKNLDSLLTTVFLTVVLLAVAFVTGSLSVSSISVLWGRDPKNTGRRRNLSRGAQSKENLGCVSISDGFIGFLGFRAYQKNGEELFSRLEWTLYFLSKKKGFVFSNCYPKSRHVRVRSGIAKLSRMEHY